MKRILVFLVAFLPLIGLSQSHSDSTKTKHLNSVAIKGGYAVQDIRRLDSIAGTFIYSGKKNEVIEMANKNVSLTEKQGRQIFAKVPGVFVYDMDGTGNQVNISTRGLDAHRSWEMNIRKDGIITNSDMYGYPASHYNIPMEAVECIEMVRGTGALQYGAQFGGMLNYVAKKPDTLGVFSFESINTGGSNGLVSAFNSVSGRKGNFRYMVWANKKQISGYRDNGDSKYDSEAVSLFYDFSKNINVKLEWTHSMYRAHLPGPLTDAMFHSNPRKATRSRNYYSPDIHIPSLTANWEISKDTRLQFTSSAVLGTRSSVMFDKPATVEDAIDPVTLQYANRQVDIDRFNSYTNELRLLHSYVSGKRRNAFSAGVQYMNNDLHRRQLGKGTTGTGYDLTLVTPGWGRNLHFKTQNVALFAEHQWNVSRKLSFNTGARMEIGKTKMTGEIVYYPDENLPNTIKHNFPLFGLNAQYTVNKNANLYTGCSTSYRPVIFKDIIPASTYEVADKELKDAKGYTAEIGYRGKKNFLRWDVSLFHLRYNNRMGTLAQTDSNGNLIIYRTNIGDSRTNGVELFLQKDFLTGRRTMVSLFTSTSFMDAQYRNATVRSGNNNVSIDGNEVESVPSCITRNGLTFKYSMVSFSVLHSFTSKNYADPLNTTTPSATGAVGIVPSYHLTDLGLTLVLKDWIKVQLNASNIFDRQYFTKRPQFYPGPGIWPSDGRTFSGTVTLKIR
ncbi:TonB-dependent receptor [Flavobacterium amniphilum]|uniref:TonB-dependent receptor family protein n=1 Tax=Flavobacterium amniphilum TaxID=1834035 RepID=UPI00202A787B|nr:TonB-dependent receptor [Flavobacterium amniphilum]MCL9806222.1 TonB-dependent receptor [Flavobacterium amniphilum]